MWFLLVCLSYAGVHWSLCKRQLKVFAEVQTWALLEKHSSGEIMVAGDANWIDEDMGPCELPPSW